MPSYIAGFVCNFQTDMFIKLHCILISMLTTCINLSVRRIKKLWCDVSERLSFMPPQATFLTRSHLPIIRLRPYALLTDFCYCFLIAVILLKTLKSKLNKIQYLLWIDARIQSPYHLTVLEYHLNSFISNNDYILFLIYDKANRLSKLAFF